MHLHACRRAILILLSTFAMIMGVRVPAAPLPGVAAEQPHAGESAAIVLPIEYVDRHVFVVFEDERSHPLTFLLDTGFENSALSRAAAGNRYVMWLGQIKLKGYGGQPAARWYGKVTIGLRVGQANVFSGSVLVLDREFIEGEIGHPADGILGWDVFSQWCTTLDIGARQLILRARAACSSPPGARAIQHEWLPQGLLLPATVTFTSGRQARMVLRLDTGCDTAIVLNPQFREIAGVGNPGVVTHPIESWGVNGSSMADGVAVSSIDLDGGAIRIPGTTQTKVVIQRNGSVARTRWWNSKEARVSRDGLIGTELLERFIWTFDPGGKTVYVAPRAEKTIE